MIDVCALVAFVHFDGQHFVVGEKVFRRFALICVDINNAVNYVLCGWLTLKKLVRMSNFCPNMLFKVFFLNFKFPVKCYGQTKVFV